MGQQPIPTTLGCTLVYTTNRLSRRWSLPRPFGAIFSFSSRTSSTRSLCPGDSPEEKRLPGLYLEEPEPEADEAEVFRRLLAWLGEADMPCFFLGDLDRRQGSFHSSALLDWEGVVVVVVVVASFSFFDGSGWRLQRVNQNDNQRGDSLRWASRWPLIEVPNILRKGLLSANNGMGYWYIFFTQFSKNLLKWFIRKKV